MLQQYLQTIGTIELTFEYDAEVQYNFRVGGGSGNRLEQVEDKTKPKQISIVLHIKYFTNYKIEQRTVSIINGSIIPYSNIAGYFK